MTRFICRPLPKNAKKCRPKTFRTAFAEKPAAQAGQKKTSRQLKRLIPHIGPVISKLSKSFI
ncbi:TPA: hypothetical protein ACMWRT_002217, partial [Neisseria gonorrhoeae]